MVMHLRPYQRLALYHLRRCLEAGVQRLYVDLPTGTGKSTIAAAFAAETLRHEELEVGLLVDGSHTLHTPTVVATVQSLTPEATQDLLAANAAAILRSILGGPGDTGLALLDPLGRSQYRWTAYSQGYFARINAHVIAILERDPAKSGLYRLPAAPGVVPCAR